jgi:hypothetical protein
MFFNVLTLHSNLKTSRMMGPNFCGLLRISELSDVIFENKLLNCKITKV